MIGIRRPNQEEYSMVRRFLFDESGTETVEWGIMAGLIVAGLVGVVGTIGTWVKGKFDTLSGDLT
jgi:pilus assembly protein Flp/PilA